MAPGSILHHISFPPTCQFPSSFFYFCNLYFPFHKPKIPKTLLYRLSISIRSHIANIREGIDNPFITLGASWCLFVQVFGGLHVVSYWIDTLVLKSWGKYCRGKSTPMESLGSLLPLAGARLRKERVWQEAHGSFTQVRAAKMRNTLVLLWWMYLSVLVFLS